MATTERLDDFLGVCNELGVDEAQFTQVWCVRCSQPECRRSQVRGTRFETRVNSWYDRLFAKVPRMDPSNPAYQMVASRKFVEIPVGRTPEIRSDWVDPGATASPEPVPPPVVDEVRQEVPALDEPPTTTGEKALNTPNRKDIMLPGAPVRQAPESPAPTGGQREVVLKPGGRFRLGS